MTSKARQLLRASRARRSNQLATPQPISKSAPEPVLGPARGIPTPHGYDRVTVEGMVANVRAANPGEPVVIVTDYMGVEVLPLRCLALSDADYEAVLAGDRVTVVRTTPVCGRRCRTAVRVEIVKS